jgi:choline dehydrogenase-like flavoprotein
MGQDARTGVVDRYGEVWATKGLFVAGAALFPTSGFANPTLSAVALAFYLAEHLLQRPRRSVTQLAVCSENSDSDVLLPPSPMSQSKASG